MITFPTPQQLLAAIPLRHSVRRYTTQSVPDSIVQCLTAQVDTLNSSYGLSFKVVTNEPKAFRNIFAYGKFQNTVNYIIISAPVGNTHTQQCGYHGQMLALGLQCLGLNTCWVGLSYSKNTPVFQVPSGHKIRAVIAFGYGQTQGSPRKTKTIQQLSNAGADAPQWFLEAMHSVQLAPTAINQQKFSFTLHPNGTVTAHRHWSIVGYTHLDMGIAIAHYNLAVPAAHQLPV